MAEIEDALVSRLLATTGLTDLISTGRVYHVILPQKPTLPAVVYALVSRERFPLMTADAGVIRSRFQIDAYVAEGAGTATLKSIASKIRGALNRWHSTGASVVVQDVYLENETDIYEFDVRMYRVSQDYYVWSEGS